MKFRKYNCSLLWEAGLEYPHMHTLMIPGECGYGAILFGQRLVNNGCVGGSAGSLKCKCDGWRVVCVRAWMDSGFLCTRDAVTRGWDRLCVSNGDGPSSPKTEEGEVEGRRV